MARTRRKKMLPPEYLQALGDILVVNSNIEASFIYYISLLTPPKFDAEENDDTFAFNLCLIGGESFENLLNRLEMVFNFVVADEELRAEFKVYKRLLSDLNAKRNKYLHTQWWTQEYDKVIYREKYSKRKIKSSQHPVFGPLAEYEAVSLETLISIPDEAAKIDTMLNNLIISNFEKIKSEWRRKHKKNRLQQE